MLGTVLQHDPGYLSKVRRQVEYYMGDTNLRFSRHMRSLVVHDGSVAIASILTFNRMKELQVTDAACRRAVKASRLLRLSEDGTRVSRTRPAPSYESMVKQQDPCTVVVFNIPNKCRSSEDMADVLASKGIARPVSARFLVKSVPRSRKQRRGCFVQFGTEAQAIDALSLLPLATPETAIRSKSAKALDRLPLPHHVSTEPLAAMSKEAWLLAKATAQQLLAGCRKRKRSH